MPAYILSVSFFIPAVAVWISARYLHINSFVPQAPLLEPLGYVMLALPTYVHIWISRGVTIPWANLDWWGWKLVNKYFSLLLLSWTILRHNLGVPHGPQPPGMIGWMAVCPSLFHCSQSPGLFLWIMSQNSYMHECACLRLLPFGETQVKTPCFLIWGSFILCKWGCMNVTFVTQHVTLDILKNRLRSFVRFLLFIGGQISNC